MRFNPLDPNRGPHPLVYPGIVFAVVVFWMGYPGFTQPQFVLYSIATLCFAILLAARKRYQLEAVTSFVVGLQFLLEIVIESSIVFSTGNINSPFSALFILTIVSAAMTYRLLGTLVVASLVSAAYAFIIWLGLSSGEDYEFSMRALRTIFASDAGAFYSIFLHILIFYLVAFISGYLAERLKERDRELADTSLALKLAKLETDDGAEPSFVTPRIDRQGSTKSLACESHAQHADLVLIPFRVAFGQQTIFD